MENRHIDTTVMGWTLQEDKALSGVQRRIVKVKRRVAGGQPPSEYTPLPSSSSHSGNQAYDQTGSQALRQMLNIGGAASHNSTTRSANQRPSSLNLPDSLDLDKLHISADHRGSSRAASAPAAAANVSQWPCLLSPVSPGHKLAGSSIGIFCACSAQKAVLTMR